MKWNSVGTYPIAGGKKDIHIRTQTEAADRGKTMKKKKEKDVA